PSANERECFFTPSFISARKSSSDLSRRATPTMRSFEGRRPSRSRLWGAGTSVRFVTGPLPRRKEAGARGLGGLPAGEPRAERVGGRLGDCAHSSSFLARGFAYRDRCSS